MQVPIWCCLLNRLAAPESDDHSSLGSGRGDEERTAPGEKGNKSAWDTALHTPRCVGSVFSCVPP